MTTHTFALLLALLVAGRAAPQSQPFASGAIHAAPHARSLPPLGFEENKGQGDAKARFLLRGAEFSLMLTKDGITVISHDGKHRPSTSRIGLVGADAGVRIEARDELPGRINYFKGSSKTQWITGVRHYATVVYRGVYPGTDLVFHGASSRLEYDWIVAPGASLASIRLAFQGRLQLSRDGDLLARSEGHILRQKRPVAYQESAAGRQAITASYRLLRAGQVGLRAAYDHRRRFIIDPILTYSTVLGGPIGYDTSHQDQLIDSGNGIALDAAGNAYVAGTAYSPDFQATNSSLRLEPNGVGCFFAKLTPAGSIVYVSFLTGIYPPCNGGAVDGQGSAYATGTSGGGIPIVNALQPKLKGQQSAFVAKLSPDGTALIYSTYLQGSGDSGGYAIAADAAGDAYILGIANSADFPVTPGAVHLVPPGVAGGVFVSKISPDGGKLLYSVLLSGSSLPTPAAIALDAAGNAYVGCGTNAPDFPTTPGVIQSANPGVGGAAVVFKLNPAGSALAYSTYVGGPNGGGIAAIAVDPPGNAYLTGSTASSNFPVTPGVFQVTAKFDPAFRVKGYVTKIDATATAVVYSTFLGGSSQDSGSGIAVDSAGNAYITGSTNSSDFPLLRPLQATLGGGTCAAFGLTGPLIPCFDAFIVKLNPAGSGLIYSTYYGGNQNDSGNAIAVSNGNVYITGVTTSPDIPITPGFETLPQGTVLIAAVSESLDAPLSTAAAITNAASYVSGLTPGGIAALFGTNLTSVTGVVTGQSLILASGTTVTVNGIEAPIVALANAGGSQQINFIVPWATGYAPTAQVVVTNNNVQGLAVEVPVTITQPGIFTSDGTHAAAQHGSGLAPVTASNPAKPGETIVLYATGLGPILPVLFDGQPAPANPLSTTVIPPSVQIGGLTANVAFSGLAPGFAGLYQVNATVPSNAPSGAADLVVISAGNASQTVKLFVQ